jgi:hypothetical protein
MLQSLQFFSLFFGKKILNVLYYSFLSRPVSRGSLSLELGVVELFSDHTIIDSIIHEGPRRKGMKNDHERLYGTFHPIRLEGHYNDSLEHYSQYDMRMKQDDKKTMHPNVSPTRLMNDNDHGRKEMPRFETSILFHNLGLAHLGMSIVCSFSSVLDEVLSEKAIQYHNQAYQCLCESFLLSAKTISDRLTATTTTSIQLLS